MLHGCVHVGEAAHDQFEASAGHEACIEAGVGRIGEGGVVLKFSYLSFVTI